ncbi:hypothetical protein GALMADRAFT_797429 [Galerina marginata CBS 339.88]|uniref:Uncharacterized protein n=1 Tax=Galerina marginata (strain CBS 339.88) TaxID=685588 RepID=A0A067SJY2_GALM3|nr:hypothetical protein GALMADRAFT_797429 [Galerina marginata CBS 339.88]
MICGGVMLRLAASCYNAWSPCELASPYFLNGVFLPLVCLFSRILSQLILAARHSISSIISLLSILIAAVPVPSTGAPALHHVETSDRFTLKSDKCF